MSELDMPVWVPEDGLDTQNLANALECIRRMALLHYIGGAFEPKHMHTIAAAAAQALNGETVPAPVDLHSPEWEAKIKEDYAALTACFDEDVQHISGAT